MTEQRLARASEVARQFDFPGRLVHLGPIAAGNVNDTYLAVFRTHFSEARGIVQRINQRVFKKPEWIIENMSVVTEHAHRRLERESEGADRLWQLPKLIAARDGRPYHVDGDGEWWRALTVIASATSYDKAQGPEHAREAGTVLGQFHRLMSDLDASRLRDTLPGFHVTPGYLKSYDEIARGRETSQRANGNKEVERLKDFVDRRRNFVDVLEQALERGALKRRLIHGDPKVNNIMIDDLTKKGTSIVDLDTVKPGLIHYDFGDALRSICNPAGEEALELDEVRFDVGLCEAFVLGYLSRASDFLTAEDRGRLYDSIRLIAFELGLRFFQDHLAGDVYFKTRYPGHNLNRARVQFRLCESIEQSEPDIRRCLEKARV
ncbi:MAG: aminoglycoside phosphotransferase family protein [Elusimicrobia bacterium]|nr:aminoglycoside phosphotransferase family protein [Elusimicrobiota bacterium]